MAWTETEPETRQETAGLRAVRARLLENGLATERHLLAWIRGLLCLAAFGLLTANAVLHIWRQSGERGAGDLWWLWTAGFAPIALCTAVLVLGAISDGMAIRSWRARRAAGHKMAALTVAALLLAAPGFAGKVKTYATPGADFAGYKTYQWMPVRVLGKSGIVEDDPDISPVVKAAVNRELTARGLTEVPQGGDLQVITCALNTYMPQLEAFLFPVLPGQPYQMQVGTMGRYNREGTFAISLIDSRTKKSAWAGMITETLDNKPGAGARKIPKATETLFKKYPVKK